MAITTAVAILWAVNVGILIGTVVLWRYVKELQAHAKLCTDALKVVGEGLIEVQSGVNAANALLESEAMRLFGLINRERDRTLELGEKMDACLKRAEANAVESVSTARAWVPKYEAMQSHIEALEKLGEAQAAEIGRLNGAVTRLILIREHPADAGPQKPAKPIRTTHRTFTGVRNAVEGRDA